MSDKLYVEDLIIGEYLEEMEADAEDGQVATWQVMPWGLRGISGGADDWDWQGIIANGGLSGTIKRRTAQCKYEVQISVALTVTATSAADAVRQVKQLEAAELFARGSVIEEQGYEVDEDGNHI